MRPTRLTLALLMLSTLVSWSGDPGLATAAEPNCPFGPEAKRVACLAEHGDPRAMYMLGRNAYAEGRKSGDLTEARQWALKTKAAGLISGKMLLKMVHVQLGEGTHRDFVQAYVWLSEAIDQGDDYLLPWQQRLAQKMTSEQLTQAKRRVNK